MLGIGRLSGGTPHSHPCHPAPQAVWSGRHCSKRRRGDAPVCAAALSTRPAFLAALTWCGATRPKQPPEIALDDPFAGRGAFSLRDRLTFSQRAWAARHNTNIRACPCLADSATADLRLALCRLFVLQHDVQFQFQLHTNWTSLRPRLSADAPANTAVTLLSMPLSTCTAKL